MDLQVPDDVERFATTARRALADPGLQAARAATRGDGDVRARILRTLDELGAQDLRCGHDPVEALAAGHLALEAGRVAAPVPVPSLLTAIAAGRPLLLQATGPSPHPVRLYDHLDLDATAAVVEIDGSVRRVAQVVDPPAPRRLLAPFASSVVLSDHTDPGQPQWWALHQAFSAFYGVGALQAAIDLTVTHVKEREQFGRPLAHFQAVQHRLADAVGLCHGLWELCHYTLLRLVRHPETLIADVLALRAFHIEATDSGFRHLHQMTGAIGFTDEYDLGVLSKAVQVHHYIPLGLDATLDHLARRAHQLDLLYPLTPPPATEDHVADQYGRVASR